MKMYICYITLTGEITRTGTCPEIDFDKQAGTGQSVIESSTHVDDITQKVDPITKKVIDKTSKELKDIKDKEDKDKEDRAKEAVIKNKMNEILRKMAVEELEKVK